MITAPPPLGYLVRHGTMRFLGAFRGNLTVMRGDRVVLRTERGHELGEILCPATKPALDQIPDPTSGDLLRKITPEDEAKLREIEANKPKIYGKCVDLIQSHRLAMQMVDVETILGGERLVCYFIAENRVDFRELVKSMAREFRTRIELRQIGVRDEAKILADFGDCGKPVCCNSHMLVMPPVSMRMAKLQKSTLDPNKISGRCGRLKCCLRFEQDVYEEFLQQLPPIGGRVVTSKGQGKVLAQEVLARRILVEFEDGRRLPISIEEVLTQLGSG